MCPAELLCSVWDLPRPGIKCSSPAWAGRSFTTEPPGKPGIALLDLISLMPLRASLVAQWLKNPPADTEDESLTPGSEDPLEKEMATHSSILAWEILWTEEPGGCSPWGHKRVGRDLVTKKLQQQCL